MKIILLDDHIAVLKSLNQMLKLEFPQDQIFEFTSFTDCKAFTLAEAEIRLVITDLRMDDSRRMDMVDLCQQLQLPCIVYSGYISKSYVFEALKKGVKGYVSKVSDLQHLYSAVRSIHRDTPYVCPLVQQQHTTVLDKGNVQKPIFTDKELELMDCLCEGNSMQECADKMNASLHTLRGYRKNMLVTNNCSFNLLLKKYIEWYH